MLTYSDIYETLRKEKYSEALQPLPKKFLLDFKEFISEKMEASATSPELFTEAIAKSKKQLENAMALFRELILKRKKKILNLVFVATETGIMKRDFENMLDIEKESFEKLTKAFEESDREISKILSGKTATKDPNTMILFKTDIEQFVNHKGELVGPYKAGDLANIDSDIAQILISEEKASPIDEA